MVSTPYRHSDDALGKHLQRLGPILDAQADRHGWDPPERQGKATSVDVLIVGTSVYIRRKRAANRDLDQNRAGAERMRSIFRSHGIIDPRDLPTMSDIPPFTDANTGACFLDHSAEAE